MMNAKFILAILILCAIVYANSLTGGFISDDIASIPDNPAMGDLSKVVHLSSLAKQYLQETLRLPPVNSELAKTIRTVLEKIK